MNQFEIELKKLLGATNLTKIQALTVGIIGAGGLGSNCAFNLVRSGFKSFVIADFDSVEVSNLNRQFYFKKQVGKKKVVALKENLLAINPDLNLELLAQEVTADNIAGLFKKCDVVVEACDRISSKKLVVAEFMNSDKLVVAASGIAGWGQSDKIKIRQINNSFYLIGDEESEIGAEQPPLAPKVNLAAAKQADVILDYVLEG